ncbi:hypothetical protein Vadar_020602 [Vaccinium darrowii]|uniref:Uncharacterized protein n=1 Tax=Vaccinium darrowii TaxID=229202 RepID=A0ACB7ZMX1_9ERIC|nr:hypothetical protein Vadar_020602 [Vaccinium darrowii]
MGRGHFSRDNVVDHYLVSTSTLFPLQSPKVESYEDIPVTLPLSNECLANNFHRPTGMKYSSSDSLDHHPIQSHRYCDISGLALTPKLSSISSAKIDTSSVVGFVGSSSSREADHSGELSVSNASDLEIEWVEKDVPGLIFGSSGTKYDSSTDFVSEPHTVAYDPPTDYDITNFRQTTDESFRGHSLPSPQEAEISEIRILNPRELSGMQSASYYKMTGAAYLSSNDGHTSFSAAAAAQSSHKLFPLARLIHPPPQPSVWGPTCAEILELDGRSSSWSPICFLLQNDGSNTSCGLSSNDGHASFSAAAAAAQSSHKQFPLPRLIHPPPKPLVWWLTCAEILELDGRSSSWSPSGCLSCCYDQLGHLNWTTNF